MPNALTLDDMSPRLRKVVGRESPRVTSTEEPDGGNLLVRIWRGVGVGNLPAYSTTAFWRRPAGRAPPPPRPPQQPPPAPPHPGLLRAALARRRGLQPGGTRGRTVWTGPALGRGQFQNVLKETVCS